MHLLARDRAARPARRVELPVLVLSGTGDPVVGNAGVATVTGCRVERGAATATLTWQAAATPPPIRTARRSRSWTYVTDGALPRDGSACPA